MVFIWNNVYKGQSPGDLENKKKMVLRDNFLVMIVKLKTL